MTEIVFYRDQDLLRQLRVSERPGDVYHSDPSGLGLNLRQRVELAAKAQFPNGNSDARNPLSGESSSRLPRQGGSRRWSNSSIPPHHPCG